MALASIPTHLKSEFLDSPEAGYALPARPRAIRLLFALGSVDVAQRSLFADRYVATLPAVIGRLFSLCKVLPDQDGGAWVARRCVYLDSRGRVPVASRWRFHGEQRWDAS